MARRDRSKFARVECLPYLILLRWRVRKCSHDKESTWNLLWRLTRFLNNESCVEYPNFSWWFRGENLLKEFNVTIIFVCAKLRSGTPGKNISDKEWGDKARVWDHGVTALTAQTEVFSGFFKTLGHVNCRWLSERIIRWRALAHAVSRRWGRGFRCFYSHRLWLGLFLGLSLGPTTPSRSKTGRFCSLSVK